jgi:curved DNA-binding protein
MNDTKSFYSKLGIEPSSSKAEIKKAYRTLSMKHHPDKNNNTDESKKKFQEINEAYETLSDDEKRQQYDSPMKGHNIFHANHGQNPQDIFSNLFGMNGMSSGMGNIRVNINGQEMNFGSMGGPNIKIFRQNSLSKPSPIIKNVEVEMSKILETQSIPIEIERFIYENDTKIHEMETIYIEIPKGADDNEIIILNNKGNIISQDDKVIKGDIKVIIKIKNDTDYKRYGLNLILDQEITLKESLCGFTFELKYLNGKSYTLNNIKGTIIQNGHNKVIQNLGLTREINGRTATGDLIIQFKIKYPDSLSNEQIDKINEIL